MRVEVRSNSALPLAAQVVQKKSPDPTAAETNHSTATAAWGKTRKKKKHSAKKFSSEVLTTWGAACPARMNMTEAVALTKARGDNTEISQIITKATITTTLLATAGTAHTMEEEEEEEEEDTMPEILEAAEEETVVVVEEDMVEGILEEAEVEVEETVEVGEAGMVAAVVEEEDATEGRRMF